jgi:hypothetical protein
MFIHLLVPLYSRNVATVIERKIKFDQWYGDFFLPYCEDKGWLCDLKPGWPEAKTAQLASAKGLSIPELAAQFPDTKYDSCDLVPKGKWVLQALSSILERQATSNYSDHDVVVMMDGSGKIDFSGACKIAERLAAGDRLVLGYRKDPRETMDGKRVDIEAFENFLVECCYKVALRDAQCGCWGFQGQMLSKLPLIAQSYAIEIDILIAALSINMEPRFIEVDLYPAVTATGAKQTDYDPSEDMKKLQFICYRLNIDHGQIPFYIERFKSDKRISLPETYVSGAMALPKPSKCPALVPILHNSDPQS